MKTNLNKIQRYQNNVQILREMFLRYNHSESVISQLNNVVEEENITDNNEIINNYDIRWSKEYKHLNEMLGIKGLTSNNLREINNIKYLVFSLSSSNHILNTTKVCDTYEKDIFYSLSLVVSDITKVDSNNRFYDKIILNLKNNSSLIRDGGIMDIYYVTSSNLDINVKEGFRFINGDSNKRVIPSKTEIINLNNGINNNQLKVNIYIFSRDTFFREYLSSEYSLFYNSELRNNIKL